MKIISSVQFRPRLAYGPADVTDNFRACEALIHAAWSAGSQLVVFPELFLTGYSFMSGDDAVRVAEPHDGRTFKLMRDVAVKLKAYVAWGYVESSGPKLHNSACLVSPDGEAVCRYRKANLWGNDFLWASPGRDAPAVVRSDLGDMSVVVCRDLRDEMPKNVPRTASDGSPLFNDRKPDLVAACVNWGKGGFPPVQWMDFVANNGCILAVANRWGREETESGFSQDFGNGGSAVIEPDWTVHTSGLQFGKDCVVTATLADSGRREQP